MDFAISIIDCSLQRPRAASHPGYGSTFRPGCRASTSEAAEDGAGHEAGAARVIVVVEAVDDFTRGIDARDRAAGRVFDFGGVRDFEAAKGEGDTGRHGIGLVGRMIEEARA